MGSRGPHGRALLPRRQRDVGRAARRDRVAARRAARAHRPPRVPDGHVPRGRRRPAVGADAGDHVRRRVRVRPGARVPHPLVARHGGDRLRRHRPRRRREAARLARHRAGRRPRPGRARPLLGAARAARRRGLGGRLAHTHAPSPDAARRRDAGRRAARVAGGVRARARETVPLARLPLRRRGHEGGRRQHARRATKRPRPCPPASSATRPSSGRGSASTGRTRSAASASRSHRRSCACERRSRRSSGSCGHDSRARSRRHEHVPDRGAAGRRHVRRGSSTESPRDGGGGGRAVRRPGYRGSAGVPRSRRTRARGRGEVQPGPRSRDVRRCHGGRRDARRRGPARPRHVPWRRPAGKRGQRACSARSRGGTARSRRPERHGGPPVSWSCRRTCGTR